MPSRTRSVRLSPRPRGAFFVAGLLAFACLFFTACRTPRSLLPEVPESALTAERQTQRLAFLEADEARRARLQTLAFPLLRVAAELYPDRARPTLGLSTLDASSLQPPYREVAIEHYALDERPLIRFVVPGSPAAEAGLLPGDRLLAVDDQTLDAADPLAQLRRALKTDTPVRLTLERDGTALTVTATPIALAPFRLELAYLAEVNALATGTTIRLNLGMLEFCQNETELAFVFAHELAHNLLRHQREVILNYLLGTAADLTLLAFSLPSTNTIGLTAAYWHSSAFEMEADYVALYLLARAGFDLHAVRDFWPRIALRGPERGSSKPTLWTHPDPAERQVRLLAAIAEIEARLAEGLPLTPATR